MMVFDKQNFANGKLEIDGGPTRASLDLELRGLLLHLVP